MIINHGVRGSIPTPSHKMLGYGGNTICVEVRTSDYQLIFDCGSGFSKVDFDNDLQTIVFISHFHHDHIQGLAFNNYKSASDKKIILGYRVDELVGPIVMIGSGGVMSEIYDDKSIRIAPV